MFCRSLFVLLYFFFWPLCCLFFFDLRILITHLVSSNSSSSYIIARKSYIRWNKDDVHFILDQHVQLNVYSSCSSLQQLFTGGQVAPLGPFILLPSYSVFPNVGCLVGKQQMAILYSLVWPYPSPMSPSTALDANTLTQPIWLI